MKNVFKKILSVIFSFFIVVGAVNFSSCSNEPASKSDSFICKKEDFTNLKGDIYMPGGYSQHIPGNMINSRTLNAGSQNKLTKGEKYYLVFVLYSDYWKKNLCYVNFEICGVSGIYRNEDAVSVHSVQNDTSSKILLVQDLQNADPEEHLLLSLSYSSDTTRGRLQYTYVAIEFTPKHSGTFSANVLMGESKAMTTSKNNWDVNIDIQASVFEHEYYMNNSSEATVSNLRYKKSVTDGEYDFSINFDFEVKKISSEKSKLYCVIYMHSGTDVNGPWDNLTIDTANTAKFEYGSTEYGKIVIFSYDVEKIEKTSAEILLKFDDITGMDIDVFITGEGIYVDGTVRDAYIENYD